MQAKNILSPATYLRKFVCAALLGLIGFTPLVNAAAAGAVSAGSSTGGSLKTAQALPDFIVQSISLNKITVVGGENVTVTVTVKNQGTAKGNGDWLDLWFDRPGITTVNETGDSYTHVGVLAAGATKTVSWAFSAPTNSGGRTVRAFVDSKNNTIESNETNNQKTALYTVAESPAVAVTLDAQGGVVSPAIITEMPGQQVSLPTPTSSHEYYTFSSWWTGPNGTGSRVDSPMTIEGNITLYAKWVPKTITITLDALGGSVSPTNIITGTLGQQVLLPTPTHTNEYKYGDTFDGWWTEPNGMGTLVASPMTIEGNIMTIKNNITLYAKWTPHALTVTLDAQGGSVSPTNLIGMLGQQVSLPTPTHTNEIPFVFTFNGWWSGPNNTGSRVESPMVIQGNTTLYAKWVTQYELATAVRSISGATATITVTPPLSSSSSCLVEEQLPAGLTATNINYGGVWDGATRKIKWGPFFDSTVRVFSYAGRGLPGTYFVSGIVSFNGVSQPIAENNWMVLSTRHPADTDYTWSLEANEVTAYGVAWKQGQHQNANYTTRAGYLWKNGEAYHDTGSGALNPDLDANRWESGVTGAISARKQILSKAFRSQESEPTEAIRTVSGATVTVNFTPTSAVSAWLVEELLPLGLAPADINNSGAWDAAARKVKWGPFFDADARTFSYTVNGADGTYSISGSVSTNGTSQAIGGAAQVVIEQTENPPDIVTVSLNTQGGSELSYTVTTVTAGSPYGTLPTPMRTGYAFAGWWTAAGGSGSAVTDTTLVSATLNHTLYALWTDSSRCPPEDDDVLTSAGSYDGFFYVESDFDGTPAMTVAGTLTLKVSSPNGKLTAKVELQRSRLSFRASVWTAVEDDGTRRTTLTARSGETLNLFVRQNRIWGTLAGDGETLTLDGGRNRFADRNDTEAAARLEQFSGYYTVAMPTYDDISASTEVDAAPQGTGYLAITVQSKGSVKIAGVLADGTRVSRSSRLILFDGCSDAACVPLFAPLYAKKGWAGGLLWLNPSARTVVTERNQGWFIRWEKPGKGPDGFAMLLNACGGFYSSTAAVAAEYLFTTGADVPYWHAEGSEEAVALPEALSTTVTGTRLGLPRAMRPKRVRGEGGDSWYEYDEINPAQATLSFAAHTGIFKGKFVLYYDYEIGGRTQHKSVRASYSGILAPLRDETFADLPAGMGHCLVPDNNPDFKALRLKRSCPVWLD